MTAVQKYAQRTNFPNVVEPDYFAALTKLRSQGFQNFGTIGFCWGGKIVIQALGSPRLVERGLKAAASLHPSMLDMEDAEKCNGAVCLLPSKDEPEIVSGAFWETIKNKPGIGERSIHKRFDDMFHGWVYKRTIGVSIYSDESDYLCFWVAGVRRWCQTRGNFSDPLNKQRAEEAVGMAAEFFKKELAGNASL